ncbi:MAG: alpha/beta hydrolase [Actinomycetota bacterium]
MALPQHAERFEHQGLSAWRIPASVPHAPKVVLVHGSLDRSTSFERCARRLEDLEIIAYDRRGYGDSPASAQPFGVEGHLQDLIAILELSEARVAIGHSFGGVVTSLAALRNAQLLDAAGAFEPPQPWLEIPGSERPPEIRPGDPGEEAERFFKRLIGVAAWDRMSERSRALRRAEGVALVDELSSIRSQRWLDCPAPSIPVSFGYGLASPERFQYYSRHLAEAWKSPLLMPLEHATHGAHIGAVDGFSQFVRSTVALSREGVISNG